VLGRRHSQTQNIFLARGGIIKLGDFGISRVMEGTEDFATTVTGTPYYMAPEVCTNQPYTYKSDVWSLGCVMYELCTLRHAFSAESLLGLLYQIVQGTFPPIPEQLYDGGLRHLVYAMLSKQSSVRPFASDLLRAPWLKVRALHASRAPLAAVCVLFAARSGSRFQNASSWRGETLCRPTATKFAQTSSICLNPRPSSASLGAPLAPQRPLLLVVVGA
jgi:serine/threonine protein kinase